ncbi:MAG TPA: hypothetical protein VJ963_04000 [Bacteroidales bacterium]|nr:hypothetical protein [Bacteroidales bacterium]
MNKISSLIFIVLIAFVYSCKQDTGKRDSFKPVFSTYNADSTGTDTAGKRYEIHYGVLTPVEVCDIFNRLGISYDMAALNPVSNADLYLSSARAAINEGIYGVDFGYLKIFGVGQKMIDYMVTVRDLADKLGIPDDYISSTFKSMQDDMAEPDTIINLMNRVYTRIENHLRESGRESTAGLIVLGGWVEAMYIATQVAYNPQNPDPQVVQKIAEQKYTLNSLLSFMKNYYDDPVVVYYTKKLKYLKNYFDSFEIYFREGDLEIDTARQVFIASGSQMTITVATLDNIRRYIAGLRKEMVTP